MARLYLAATLSLLVGAVLSPRLGALYLVTCFYFAFFVALPAVVQIDRRRFPFGSIYTDSELNAGFLVFALGQLCLVAAVATVGRHRRRSSASAHRAAMTDGAADLKRAARIGVGIAFVGAVVAALAGPERIFATRFDETGSVVMGEGIETQLIFVARAFALVGVLLCTAAVKRTPRGLRANVSGKLIVAAAVATVVNFPPALPRFQLLGIALAIAVLLINFQRPITKLIFTFGATLFLLYLFSTIKDLTNGISLEAIGQRDVRDYLVTVDFDSYKQVVDTVIYFSSNPLRWGENFLGAILFWVPRALWPDKAVHTGELVSSGLGYPFTNVSNPLPAEAFASWGIVGTVLIMLVIGAVIGKVEGGGLGARLTTRPVPAAITYALAAGYATILLRGALNAVAPMIFSAFLLAAVVHLIYRDSRLRDSRARDRNHWVEARRRTEGQPC